MSVGSAVGIDLYAADEPMTIIPLGIIDFVLAYWLTTGLLSDLGRRPPEAGGIGEMFVVSVVGTLAILVGLVFLIVPGIFLMIRWSVSVPLLLSEPVSAIDALRESWHETKDREWPILAVVLVTSTPLIVAAALIFVLGEGAFRPLGSVLINGAYAAGTLLTWHSAVALYLATDRGGAASAEVSPNQTTS